MTRTSNMALVSLLAVAVVAISGAIGVIRRGGGQRYRITLTRATQSSAE